MVQMRILCGYVFLCSNEEDSFIFVYKSGMFHGVTTARNQQVSKDDSDLGDGGFFVLEGVILRHFVVR